MLALVLCALGQTARDPDLNLAQARERLRAMTRRLPKYTCTQTVERRYYRPTDEKAAANLTCDERAGALKSGRLKTQLYAIDRLRMDVAVAEGKELVSWAGAGRFDSRSMQELVGEGPTGTGAFGLHLVGVFANDGTHFQYQGETTEAGRDVLKYRYTVPIVASNYRVRGGNREWHLTAYDGTFQIDAASLDLLNLEVRTAELPDDTGMCEARTTMSYQHLKVGDGDFLLPRETQMLIQETNGNETNNVTTFSACHEYHAESTIRFDEEPTDEPGKNNKTAQAALVVPPGLALNLALNEAIDTSTAAAGDAVSATVTSAVREAKSKQILVPAGAIVHGRITRLRRRMHGPDDLIVLIDFETLEANGRTLPARLRLDPTFALEQVVQLYGGFRRPDQRAMSEYYRGPETWGALIFLSSHDRYVVPKGFRSKWLTTEATQGQRPPER